MLLEVADLVMGYLLLRLATAHHLIHNLGSLVVLGVLLAELGPWTSPKLMVTRHLGSVSLIEVFVSLFNGEEDLAAAIAKLHAPHPMTILIVHFALGLLGIIDAPVVDEGVRAVLCVRLCLLHPDCSHSTLL